MTGGYCLGQHRHREFPSSWKVLLANAGVDEHHVDEPDRLPVFENKVLLASSHTHLFTYCLWLIFM